MAIYIAEVNDGLFIKTYSEKEKDKALEDFEYAKNHPLVNKVVVNEVVFADGKEIRYPIAKYDILDIEKDKESDK